MQSGHQRGAAAVIRQIEPDATDASIAQRLDAIAVAAHERASAGRFWSTQLRRPILLAILIAFFNQLSGINAVLYYAPRIFELTGLGERAALLQSVGIGFTNLAFTLVGLWMIDRFGRRTLLYLGSFGYIGSLGLCAWACSTGRLAIVPACIFAFIAAHAVGQGAVIWVFISEIFPDRHRAAGQSLGSFTHWMFAALLTAFFPAMVTAFQPSAVFLFFCLMMVLQLAWVMTMVPETRGRPLEEIAHDLV
jgi:MFS family permease